MWGKNWAILKCTYQHPLRRNSALVYGLNVQEIVKPVKIIYTEFSTYIYVLCVASSTNAIHFNVF